MKLWQRLTWSILLSLVSLCCLAGVALAETVITDGDGVNGFELYQNGLYWWSAGGACSGEFPHESTIRLRHTLSSNSTKSLLKDCTVSRRLADNAVRDDSYVYFFQNGQLSRKALNASQQDAAQALTLAPALPAGATGANLVVAEGKLYWAVYNVQNNNSTLFRMPDGTQAPTTITTALRQIYQLAWRRYTDTNSQSQEALVWLTDDARLFRYRIGSAGAPQELASTVADFAIHTTFNLLSSTTSIYAAIGAGTVDSNTAPGKVLQINIETGNQSTVYNATGHDQVLAVGTDSAASLLLNAPTKNIYIAVASVACGELFCSFGNTSIHRHALPANTSGWQLIVASGVGGTLRSDDQWLYYVNSAGTQIERVKTNAPALELDLKADGVEIVQVVQSLNQDVKLVTGKPTFARGYAHFVKNTTGKSDWLPSASLRGFLNGVELPGSPLAPVNSVNLDTTSDINVLRNDLSRSYLFRLPAQWVKNAGALTVEFMVDPQDVLPETASRTDNKIGAKAPATVVKKADTCLDFVRMHTVNTIAANPTGLTEIVARAKTLLPVQEFQVRTSNTRISKPVFHVDIECWGPFCVPVPYFTDEPFDMSEDKSWALTLLTIWDTFHSDFGSCSDSHLVGMVHPSETEFNGQGLTTFSNDLMARMEPGAFSAPGGDTVPAFNVPYGGRTLAHELGHNYGREHVDQTASMLSCGGTAPASPDTSYPYDTCTIGANNTYNGFDTQTQSLLLPASVGDLMSYATVRWTSKYTWDAILDEVTAAADVQAAAVQVPNAAMLLVTGMVTPTQGTGRFETFYLLPEGAAPQAEVLKQFAAAVQVAASSADPYLIRQLDATGATLVETQLVLDTAHDDAGPALPFAQYVTFNAQTKRVQLVQSNKVLAEKTASATAPTLTVQAPVLDAATQTMNLQWLAFDNDNTLAGGFTDVLFFTVQYSPDNGVTWYNLLVQYPWLAATVDTDLLPGSNSALVRVLASDGFNTTIATSAPFALAKHAPTPTIGGVTEGERIPYTGTVTLLGLGLDAEDGGVPADKLSWTISGPTTASGTGSQLDLSQLLPGAYMATLTATDSDNQTGAATRHFEVLPLVVADRTQPTLDGACADAGYATAPMIVVPMPNGLQARGWLLHIGGNLYACFTDLQLAAANAPTMTFTLRFDVDNSGGNTIQTGDLGFGVDQEGTPYQLVAANGALQPTLTPQLGYSAVVARSVNGWSAELAIAETLLGGWNHAVRLLVSHTGVDALQAANLSAATGLWPETGNRTQPATWAAAYLGTLALQNQAPVAVAGDDLYENVAVTKTLGLDGSGSFDPDGSTVTYSWSQVAGPAVTLSSNTSATPTFQVTPVTVVTVLRFQLVVNDGGTNSVADEIVVTLLPTARPHTAKTFTPSDAAAQNSIYLPLIQR